MSLKNVRQAHLISAARSDKIFPGEHFK